MKQAEKERLLAAIDQAIDCIENLDDRSPISAEDLRDIQSALIEVPNDEA